MRNSPAKIAAGPLLALALCASCAAPHPPARQQGAAAPPALRAVEYQPGIVIDYPANQVLVDAEIVLRQGVLELLACCPHTKEHESILRVLVRPLHVYEALGLLGVQPGRPPGWDPKHQTRIPPRGDPLEIVIRYPAASGMVEVNAWDWMLTASDPPTRPRPSRRRRHSCQHPTAGPAVGAAADRTRPVDLNDPRGRDPRTRIEELESWKRAGTTR